MTDKTYFKGVTKIGLDDWNSTYMQAYDDGSIQDRKELLSEIDQFSTEVFDTVIEDTDGGLYSITATMLEDDDVVVLVKPFKKEII